MSISISLYKKPKMGRTEMRSDQETTKRGSVSYLDMSKSSFPGQMQSIKYSRWFCKKTICKM